MKNLVIIALLFLSACSGPWMGDLPQIDKNSMFNALWNDINENYIFLNQKEVDWPAIKAEFERRLSDELSDEQYFELLCEMLQELRDGHVSLYSGFNKCSYYDLYLNHEQNFDRRVLEQNYLEYPNRIGPFVYDIIDENIAYVYYESFGDDFTEDQLAYLIDFFRETRGLVIDIRDNLGGAADNALKLMSAFTKEHKVVGILESPASDGNYMQQKIEVKSIKATTAFTKNVCVLTNRSTYSAAHVFAAFMQELPNVKLLGDSTGGGTGISAAYELANGWRYRFPVARVLLSDAIDTEDGLAPDISVVSTKLDAASGRDKVLEEAIKTLKQ